MRTLFIPLALFLYTCALGLFSSCNSPTPPDSGIECPEGYHVCGADSSECCLDTTSHTFVWRVDTLKGDYNFLKDVSILGPNDIWVVGEIRMPETRYNGAHWDGTTWQLTKIQWEVDGQSGTNKLESVFSLSLTDTWAADTAPYHLEGTRWISYGTQNSSWEFGGYVYDIWGNDSADVYFVGTDGAIVHYDGTDFTKMTSGTSIRLRSVAGFEDHVFASGFNDQAESVVLELQNGQWQTLLHSFSYRGDLDSGDYGMATCLDVLADTSYIMTKSGLLKYAYLVGESEHILNTTLDTEYLDITTIKVRTANDIHLFSAGGRHVHYNGVTWVRSEEMVFDYLYHGADFKYDTAAMVGRIGGVGGFVMIGQRLE